VSRRAGREPDEDVTVPDSEHGKGPGRLDLRNPEPFHGAPLQAREQARIGHHLPDVGEGCLQLALIDDRAAACLKPGRAGAVSVVPPTGVASVIRFPPERISTRSFRTLTSRPPSKTRSPRRKTRSSGGFVLRMRAKVSRKEPWAVRPESGRSKAVMRRLGEVSPPQSEEFPPGCPTEEPLFHDWGEARQIIRRRSGCRCRAGLSCPGSGVGETMGNQPGGKLRGGQ